MVGQLDYFDLAPEAIAILDRDGVIENANARFSDQVAKLSRVKGLPFIQNLISPDEVGRFKVAFKQVLDAARVDDLDSDALPVTPILRDAVTLILSSEISDLPIYRRFDWAISTDPSRKNLILSGRLVTIVDESRQAAENELIDFFNKAPIALHWLSNTGHVLWANETEMNTLGYSAEEYIGQPIMRFCPDEEELVLEIFKQLGSGNTVRDVPVRFRTKTGEIRNLLIDSNVNYNPDKTFNHTRCFIRDDTARKVREARLEARMDAAARAVAEKDGFIRKTFHEIRTPCHVLLQALSLLELALADAKNGNSSRTILAVQDAEKVLAEAAKQAERLAQVVDDVADASSFEFGLTVTVNNAPFDPRRLLDDLVYALSVLRPEESHVKRVVNVGKDVPKILEGDARILGRILQQLFDNGIKFTKEGEVCVSIQCVTDQPGKYLFEVSDTGPGMNEGSVNAIFQKYWQATPIRPSVDSQHSIDYKSTIGNSLTSTLALSEIEAPRAGSAVSSLSLNSGCEGLGLGLNVSFNLVQCLGGELKVSAHPGGTTLRFIIALDTSENQSMDAPGLPNPRSKAANLSVLPNEILASGVNSNEPEQTVVQEEAKLPGKSSSSWAIKMPKIFTMLRSAPGVSAAAAPKENSSSVRSRFSILSKKGQDQSYQWQPVVVSEVASAFMKTGDVDNNEFKKPVKYTTGVGLESNRAPHILLVEDNTICQRVTQHGLRKLGCECDIAGNGRIAIQSLEGNTDMYDLIIMDLRMPVMDGLEATSYIRNKLKLKVPILGFSAEITQQIKDQCLAAGMQGFLPKPASIVNLGTEIRGLIPHLPISVPMPKENVATSL